MGLVAGRRATLFPHRIFADLLQPWRAACVKPGTPLEAVQKQLLDGLLYCLPVVDNAGSFVGAVTRDSVLRVLLGRERQMFQVLKQGVNLQEQQHSLIAFEIHDGLVQCITAARMHLESAAQHLDGLPPEGAAEFARGLQLLQQGIDEARCLIRGLHPPILEGMDLVPAIESLIEQQQTFSSGEIEFLSGPIPPQLSRFQQTSIFRIVQEALTNAVRHSGAGRVRVAVSQQADEVCIEVCDWGCGFNVHAPSKGFGLKGIRHRARALQGKADITSSPGKGTQITVRFPSASAPMDREAELA